MHAQLSGEGVVWIPELEEGIPKIVAIVRALRSAIETGELPANTRLPAQRELARRLGINLSTVTRAFEQATQEGLIAGEVGRGTFVMPQSRAASLFTETIARAARIDMARLVPPVIDDALLTETLGELLGRCGEEAFTYPSLLQVHRGCDMAREWMRWRGLRRNPAHVAITAGAQAGLQALLTILLRAGQSILVEEHTFPGLRTTADLIGLRLVGVACDGQGLVPEELEQAQKRSGANVVFATPNLQNPTGAIMGPQRRRAIAETVARLGLLLVEDDVYGSYTSHAPLVAECEGPHILISSLSKAFSPGLRFGFVMGDHPAVARLEKEVSMSSWLAAPVMIKTAAKLISNGVAMTHAVQQKRIVQERWSIVKRLFPEVPDTAQTHLWLAAPGGEKFTAAAERHGVEIVPASAFCVARQTKDLVRCSITSVRDDAELAHGLATIRDLGAYAPSPTAYMR
jgi:DNA-binding transcriptional MocR family regulator